MALLFLEHRSDRITMVSSLDSAVVTDTDEQKTAFRKYLETLDEKLLTLCGDPARFTLRPLTQRILDIAARDARGMAIPGVYTDDVTCREIARLVIEDIKPWPAELGKAESAWSFEHRMKALHPDVAERLPKGLCREISSVALDTLPRSEPVPKDAPDPFPA